MLRGSEGARLAGYYLAGDPRTPDGSPLYADPTRLPPTLIQVGSRGVLLDDSVSMAERMRAAGCQVELEIWPRMPYTWQGRRSFRKRERPSSASAPSCRAK